MKTVLILVLTVGMSLGMVTTYGQSEKIGIKDSVEVSTEREQISRSLVQLRDSINNSITMLDDKKIGAPTKSKQGIDKAVKELVLYKEKVVRDIEEIEDTSKKGWDSNSVIRIQTTMLEVRREYKRISKDVKPFLGTKS